MTTHLRDPKTFAPVCGSNARVLRTTATPASTDCKRCRKVAGLGKYDPFAALRGIVNIGREAQQ